MIISTGIYKISEIDGDRFYIGSSVNINKRWKEHIYLLKLNAHSSPFMQRTFNKHGVDKFKFEILELCERDQLLKREQYYIDTLNPCFNVCRTAGSTLGQLHTPETKAKISAIHKGKTITQEHRDSCAAKLKNRVISPEHRKAISDGLKNHTRTSKHSGNISKALKGKEVSKLIRAIISINMSKYNIVQYDLAGNKIKIHLTSSFAEMNTGLPKKNIQKCCRGKYKTAGGFIFKYELK